MRGQLFLIVLLLFTTNLVGQGPVGSWEDHLPYQSVKKVVAGESEIFAATDFALMVYNKQYQEIRKLSKVHGLTECGVSTIGYSDLYNTLIIAYSSTNIDLYSSGAIINIPDVLNKYVAGKKEISGIFTSGDYAYLLTSFGIILIDLKKAEVYDTWNPSLSGSATEVYDIAFSGNTVYATTSEGLLKGDLTNQALTYFGNWSQVTGFDQNNYKYLIAIDDKVFVSKSAAGIEGDSLLMYNEGVISHVSSGVDNKILSLDSSPNSLLVSTGTGIKIYNNEGLLIREVTDYGWGMPTSNSAIIDGGILYISDSNFGVVKENSPGLFESLQIPGPYYNSAASIYSENGKVYVSGGLLNNAWNNTWTSFRSFFYEERKWSSVLFQDSWDVMRIRPFPNQSERVFVSTWGTGVFELQNYQVENHYKDDNSPLETIIPGANYVRICGMAFDDQNNLWLTQTGVENSIKVLKPDNSWIVLPYTIDAPTIGDIIITRTGLKWVVLPRGHGLFILDDNHTPENFGDDIWKKLSVKDQDGKTLNTIYSITEDLDGNIWIGTDQGPAVFYNPDRVIADDINCYRIKVPRNDGSGLADYLLGTETINTISVDGGNRKWFGTNSSGLFLVKEDGKELIRSYNENDSPLLSNSITSIDIDDTTGEVWIGTDKGIITVRGVATGGGESLGKVYAFPNPVRPEFVGSVTITGLARNTTVKITDISGNLVYETTSSGGQATWDQKGYNESRVSTGVYLAFCSTEDGSSSAVIKILIVN